MMTLRTLLPRRRPAAVGLSLGLATWVLPAAAHALPAPLILLPLAIGVFQFLLVALALIFSRPLGWLKWLVILAGGAALGGPLGAVVAVLGGLAWHRPRRWLTALALLFALDSAWTFLFVEQPSPLSPLPAGEVDRAPPNPRAPLASLVEGGAIVIHIGEAEEFSKCRAPHGYLLRPADVEAREEQLRALVAKGPVVGLVSNLASREPLVSRLSALGIEVLQKTEAVLHDRSKGAICYFPAGSHTLFALTHELSHVDVPDVPGADFHGIPRLRASDIAPLEAPRFNTTEILETPSHRLRAGPKPMIVLGDDLARTAAAVRLWREAGGVVLATSPAQKEPDARAVGAPRRTPPAWAIITAVLALALVAIGLEHQYRLLLGEWFIDATTRGRPSRIRGWLAKIPAPAVTLPIGIVAAYTADQLILPPSLGQLVTPTIWGGSAWLGPPLLLLSAALVYLRLGHLRLLLLGLAALGLVAALGVATGPAPLPLHLLAFLLVFAPPWIVERLGSRASDVVPLSVADRFPWTGNKAKWLAGAVRDGLPVPPGFVVRRASDKVAKRLVDRLPSAPLIVRSSGPDDDKPAAAGRYATARWEPEEPLDTLRRRIDEVARACHGAALVMPRVPSEASGVVAVGLGGGRVALVEEAGGSDGVTSGADDVARHWVGAFSHSVTSEGEGAGGAHARSIVAAVQQRDMASGEWLLRRGQWLLVQLRPEPEGPPLSRGPDGALALLEGMATDDAFDRVLADGLPDPARIEVVALWASRWRRSDALGDAYRLLGLPRLFAPRQAVFALGGRLYASRLAAKRMQAPLLLPDLPKRCHKALIRFSKARPFDDPMRELRRLAALSMVLHLVRPLFAGTATEGGDLGEDLPSLRFAKDLAGGRVDAWPHRALFDLDPSCERYGSTVVSPLPLPALPSREIDLDLIERWRDALLDRMAREVARLACLREDWGPLPSVPARRESYSMQTLELEGIGGQAIEEARRESRGTWVSGSGPIEGQLSPTPSPGAIWVVPKATPELAAHWDDCAAIVCATGGMLSHLAMVARAQGKPALFGAGPLPEGGKRVRLEASGQIELLD